MPAEFERIATVVTAAAFGPVFGSFVTALTHRLPRGESIAHGRSQCPACHHVLGALDLVPILSWIANRGRCRHCGVGVSARYPIIEAISLTLFVVSALAIEDPIRAGLAMALAVIGLALAVIDFEHQQLPNALVGLLIPVAALWRWRSGNDFEEAAAAAAIALIGLLALNRALRRTVGADAISGGDIKLIVLAAFALPIPGFLAFLLLANAAGILLALWWRRRTGQERFPFGVTLMLAWWACLIASPWIERLQA